MEKKVLVLVGAGPKSIAICAKAAVLKRLGYAVPKIIVLEQHRVAAHWCGHHGFTDGGPQLGTPPEKDIGFPYHSTCWGDSDDRRVDLCMSEFSWQSYLVSQRNYAEWVDRGRCHPTHAEFCEYLNWCFAKSSAELASDGNLEGTNGDAITRQRIVGIDLDQDKRWHIRWKDGHAKDGGVHADGLVFTGPGGPVPLPNEPENHDRVMTGANFWLRKSSVFSWDRDSQGELNVAVVGAGETAAAIACALIAPGSPVFRVDIVNPYGVLYSRGESFTENQMFTRPHDWSRLSPGHREEVVRRGDRGVFSVHAQQVLNKDPRVTVTPGRVERVQVEDYQLYLTIRYHESEKILGCSYLVSAVGFFPLSLMGLFQGALKSKLSKLVKVDDWRKVERDRPRQKLLEKHVQASLENDLGTSQFGPRLHLPMLAGFSQGPGFANLSCLGLLSDRILKPYVSISPQRSGPASKKSRVGVATAKGKRRNAKKHSSKAPPPVRPPKRKAK